jgi:hypothetical protein
VGARFELLDRVLKRRLDAARPASPDVAWALAAHGRKRRAACRRGAVRGARVQPRAHAASLERADRRRAERPLSASCAFQPVAGPRERPHMRRTSRPPYLDPLQGDLGSAAQFLGARRASRRSHPGLPRGACSPVRPGRATRGGAGLTPSRRQTPHWQGRGGGGGTERRRDDRRRARRSAARGTRLACPGRSLRPNKAQRVAFERIRRLAFAVVSSLQTALSDRRRPRAGAQLAIPLFAQSRFGHGGGRPFRRRIATARTDSPARAAPKRGPHLFTIP